jgi:hypothetical protein
MDLYALADPIAMATISIKTGSRMIMRSAKEDGYKESTASAGKLDSITASNLPWD